MNFSVFLIVLSFVRTSICTTLTDSQRSAVLSTFNSQRTNIGAKKMEVLTWNEDLANSMDTKFAQCSTNGTEGKFETQPGRKYATVQTTHTPTSSFVDVTPSFLQEDVDDWYSLSSYYNYDDNLCSPGNINKCDVYRIVSEWSVIEIGCAYERCLFVDGVFINPGGKLFVGCLLNYADSRTIGVDPPYVKESFVSSSLATSTTTKTTTISSSLITSPVPTTTTSGTSILRTVLTSLVPTATAKETTLSQGSNGLTNRQISAILERFNYRRRLVGAKNIEPLTWNQNFSDAMNSKFAQCRQSDPPPPYSQKSYFNYYDIKSVKPLSSNVDVTTVLQDAVDYFYSLSSYYNYDTNTCSYVHTDECNTYRAAVEWSALEIGCAYRECPSVADSPVTGRATLFGCLLNYHQSRQIGIDRPYNNGTCISPSWSLSLFLALLITSYF